MKSRLRILAVDDHQLFLQGLKECLCSLPVVDKVVTCNGLIEMNAILANWVPDIIFLDLNLREHDGFSICRQLKAAYQNVFVAILTHYDLKKLVDKAKDCGADAYFIKNTDADVLASFINDFSKGNIREFYLHMPEPANIRPDIFKNDFFEWSAALTKREKQIMGLLVQGWGHAEIEKSLGISYETFKTHRGNIFDKLNVKNIAELVLLNMQHKPESVDRN